MKMKHSLLFTLFFSMLFTSALFAQSDVTTNAFLDDNGNGLRDIGEPPLSGISVTLFDAATNLSIAGPLNTNAMGIRVFPNIVDGDYYVVFGNGGQTVTLQDASGSVVPDTDPDDSDADPANGQTHTFTIAGIDMDGISIGLFTPVEINGNVWLDVNGNGIDEGDGPIPQAVDVTLLDDLGNLVTTDADGNALANPVNTTDAYSFTNLFPGDYIIEFEEPGGSHPTGLHLTLQDELGGATQATDAATDSDADPVSGQTFDIFLGSGDPPLNNVDAGYYVVAEVGDFVWEDLNGNGIQDGGEPGLAGITVTLELASGGAALDPDGNPIPAQITGGAGDYLFDEVPPGDYVVVFESPALPYYLTKKDEGGDDAIDSDADQGTGETDDFTLESGDSNIDLDAGYYQKCTIGDFTFEDLNANGVNDGEPGLDGIDIEITDDVTGGAPLFEVDGTTAYNENTTSAGGGMYLFDNLPPGTYYLTFTALGGYYFTEQDAGADTDDSDPDPLTGITIAVTCNSGDEITDLDAGLYTKCTVGDFTWEDLNGNGIQDGGEPGLAVDISITDDATGAAPLFEVDGVTGYNANITSGGNYIFDDLKPGTYFLTFTAPGTYFFTQQNAGSGNDDSDPDQTTGITVAFTCESGQVIEDIDAGFFRAGEIRGYAFHDQDADGINSGEPLLDGITFELRNLNGPTNDVFGNPIPTQTVMGTNYIFIDVPPGEYSINATAPGWIYTIPNASGDPGDNPDASDDSDFDDSGTLINNIQLEGGELVVDRAAGLYKLITLGGSIWGEDDDNCNLAGETGGFNVTVELYDEDGALVGTAVGDVNGNYQFDGLVPGIYQVVLPGTNFVSGAPLYGLESCDCTGGDDDVDNDDNGSGPMGGPITTVDIELLCGLEPGNMGLENLTIDFCFQADCDALNPLTVPSCGTVMDTICDLNILNLLCTRMPAPPLVGPAPNPLCANGGAPHNMSWLAFVAGSGVWSIDINIFGCTGGQNGAQIGVLEIQDCDFGAATEIFCIGNPCVTGIQSIPNTNMTPGNTYYLWLDGCAGSVCSYDVEINGNFIQYQVPDPVDIACTPTGGGVNCDTVCPNTTLDFEALDAYDNLFADYTWTVTDPSGAETTVATEERFLNYTFTQVGAYLVELTAIYVKCSALPIAPYAIEVVVANPPDEDFGIHEICENYLDGEFGPWDGPGVVWNTTINDPNNDGWIGWFGPGGFTTDDAGEPLEFDITTPDGCQHKQTVEILTLLNSQPYDIDTIMCNGESLEVGPYSWDFPFDDLYVNFPNAIGCDSIINVSSAYLALEGEIVDVGCTGGGYQIKYVQINNPNVNQLLSYDYIWTFVNEGAIVDDGDPDGDPTTLLVEQSGEYEVMVIVTLEDGSKSCQFPILSAPINVDNLVPPMVTEEGNWGTLFCDGASAAFTYEISTAVDPNEIINYLWTYPGGVDVSGPNDTTAITLDWAGTNGGPLCMSIQTLCGTSPPLCDTIKITPIPVAALPAVPSVCVDSFAVITAQGSSQPAYVYNWDFDGGSPIGAGAGPYQVSWGSEGLKEIELVIDNLNCFSTPATSSVQVVAPLTPPVVSCTTPGIGLVDFTWEDISGNIGYQVDVLTMQSGTQGANTMNFSGLSEGDSVHIQVTTLLNSPCGNLVSDAYCISQSCVPPSVIIDPVNNICLTASTTPFVLSTTITPSSNGTYIFTGPGIIDAATGLFDPNQAFLSGNTAGISLQYIDPDNCKQFASRNINVYETPTADFATDKGVICQDSFVVIEYNGNITTGGNFDWEFGPGVVAPGNGSGPFDIEWGTPGQKTIELTVTKNGCISETETFNVTVEPRILPLEMDCTDQQPTEITVGWNAIPNITDYTIIVDNTTTLNTNGLSHTITGLVPDSEHTFELIANSNNSCPGTSITLTCAAVACPATSIDFSINDTTICLNAGALPFKIDAIITGGLNTGTGTTTWSGKGIDPVTGIFDPVAAGISTGNGHRITALFEEETCDESASIFIKVINQPTSTFTGIDAICITDEYNVIFTGTGGLPLDWQEPSGVTITPNGVGRYKVDFPNAGTYTFGLQVGVNGCLSNLTEKTVEVQDELDIVDIDCSTTLNSVEFSWNDIDCVTDYEITIDGVNEGTQSTLNYLLTGLPEGQEVEILITPISDCECPALAQTLKCKAKACPPVQLALTSPQNNFCEGDLSASFQLNAGITGSDGTGVGVWSGTAVSAQGQFNPAGLAPGTYTLNYEFGEANCSFDDDINIVVLPNPTVSVVATNPDCYLQNVGSIIPTTSGGSGSNYTYRLDGNAVTNIELNNINPGSHILVVNDGNNCDASTNFSIVAAQPATISVSGQSLIILGESVRLNSTVGNVAANQIDSIVWTNSTGEVLCSGANCSTITITPEVDDTYCAMLFYNNGCHVEDCFDVELKKIIEIILPNIIRPGNTTNNSFFVEQYENIKIINSMSIFDRWGNLVFTQKDFLPGSAVAWDGKLANKDIVPGVYAYTIDLTLTDDEPLLINGDVTVIR